MTERFTDRHVTENYYLRQVAKDYLLQYTGSFEYLVGAKQALRSNGSLHTHTVRGVLNCMLSDSTVTGLVVPPYQTFDASRSTDPGELEDEPIQVKSERRRYPSMLRLKTTWKVQYGISKRPNALLVHTINQATSGLSYWTGECNGAESPFRWRLNWNCNPYLHMSSVSPTTGNRFADRYHLLDKGEMEWLTGEYGKKVPYFGLYPRPWKLCAKCLEGPSR